MIFKLGKRFSVFACFLWFFFCFVNAGYAGQNDLIITADLVAYDNGNNLISATGSVEAAYKDLIISADQLDYNTKLKKVKVKGNFNFRRNALAIRGDNLSYFVASEEGTAADVFVVYAGVYLSGKIVDIKKNQIALNGASFDSCGLTPPHYHISARDIILYPDIDWVVAYWGFFWLGRFPLMPIPAYLYDLKAKTRESRNAPPFPEVGSNDEDGLYINERVAWHGSKNWNGRLTLSYYEKKGFGGGMEAAYRLDDTQEGNLRIFGNAIDQWYGGFSHHVYFGKKIQAQNKGQKLEELFGIPKEKPFDFLAELTYRERVNYEKVSYYPRLRFSSQPMPMFNDQFKWDINTALGAVKEESSGIGVGFYSLALGAYYDLSLWDESIITPSIKLDHRLYGNGQNWLKATQNIEYKKNFGKVFGLGFGHLHYLYNLGESPFNFEKYLFAPRDELTAQAIFRFNYSKVEIKTAHYLPELEPKDVDYILSLGFHCYDIILTYRAIRNEVQFGFNLIAR